MAVYARCPGYLNVRFSVFVMGTHPYNTSRYSTCIALNLFEFLAISGVAFPKFGHPPQIGILQLSTKHRVCRCCRHAAKNWIIILKLKQFQNWESIHNYCEIIFSREKIKPLTWEVNIRSLGRLCELREWYPNGIFFPSMPTVTTNSVLSA